jgi:hypothetical protein
MLKRSLVCLNISKMEIKVDSHWSRRDARKDSSRMPASLNKSSKTVSTVTSRPVWRPRRAPATVLLVMIIERDVLFPVEPFARERV